MESSKPVRGFTLVELLIVVTIIGLLLALLLPAVQSSRESARWSQCNNNLKQIALACLNCESAVAHMPAGGWATTILGDPERGAGCLQTGGPIYNLLPYLEQQPLYSLPGYRTAGSSPSHVDAAIQLATTPVPGLICPSRRPVQAFKHQPTGAIDTNGTNIYDFLFLARGAIATGLTLAARSDYCGNGYDYVGLEGVISLTGAYANPSLYALLGADLAAVKGSPTQLTASLSGTGSAGADATVFRSATKTRALISATNMTIGGRCGVFYPLSVIRMCQIADGTSSTYLFGEKYLNPDNYLDGLSHGDSYTCFEGGCPDTLRYSAIDSQYGMGHFSSAYRDASGFNAEAHWGGPHVGGFNMAFCDGSVHTVSFGIASTVHSNLGNRVDGAAIDPASLTRE